METFKSVCEIVIIGSGTLVVVAFALAFLGAVAIAAIKVWREITEKQ